MDSALRNAIRNFSSNWYRQTWDTDSQMFSVGVDVPFRCSIYTSVILYWLHTAMCWCRSDLTAWQVEAWLRDSSVRHKCFVDYRTVASWHPIHSPTTSDASRVSVFTGWGRFVWSDVHWQLTLSRLWWMLELSTGSTTVMTSSPVYTTSTRGSCKESLTPQL